MENDVLYNRIMNVIHEEYGEGSTAVANPEGEPTDDLNSIQIGDEIYGISGGSGSGNLCLTLEIDENSGNYILDKNFAEIKTAMESGSLVYFLSVNIDPNVEGDYRTDLFQLKTYGHLNSMYAVQFFEATSTTPWVFICSTEDGVLMEAT